MDKEEALDEFFDEDKPKNKGLIGFFRKAIGLKQEEELEEIAEKNEFASFLEDIPDSVADEDYSNVKEITHLCSYSINIIAQKMNLLSNNRKIENEIHNTKYIADLSDEDVSILKKKMDYMLNLSRENTRLMYQVTGYNKAISELQGKTDIASDAIPEIEYAERQAKFLKNDIYLIESERSEIFEQYDNFNEILSTIDKVSKIGLGVFSVIAFVLIYINVVNSVRVFDYIIMLIIAVVAIYGGMYVAKLEIGKKLKLNVKKQARAVELLNKKNVVLAHYINYLNYEYDKFDVENAGTLRNNLDEFKQYKIVANRKTATRRALEETEADIKDFFTERGKVLPNIPVQKFVEMIDIDNKKIHYDKLVLERIRVEEEVAKLDVEQEKLWENIEYLQATTNSQKEVISDILKAYYAKLDKIMNSFKNVFEPTDNNDISENSDDKE